VNANEVRKYVRDLVAAYYGDSHVFYAEQKMTKLPAPYITVKFSSLRRQRSRINLYDSADGSIKSYWSRSITAEINLYTKGSNSAPDGYDEVYDNTAISDMEDFVNYLYSDAVTDDMVKHNVAIADCGEVNDLTSLLNESMYRYRAMLRLTVDFTDCTYGDYGQDGVKDIPNSSNGGTTDMQVGASTIEDITIKGGLSR